MSTVPRENLPLTALRGVASVWAVGFHAAPLWFAGAPAAVTSALLMGRTAVDIFFILSGFILARVYGALRLQDAPLFWLRRICRIYPLHLAVLGGLGALSIIAVTLHGSHHTHDLNSFVLESLMLHPFLADEPFWNPPTWSVAIEFVCYALFPFVVHWAGRSRQWVFVLTAIVLAVAEAWVLHRYNNAIAGYGAVLRGLAGFYLGAALGYLALRPSLATPASLLAAGGLVVGTAVASPALIALSSALLILSLSAERGPVAWLLSTSVPVWLGRVSFSIYMVHGPLLYLLQRAPIPGGTLAHIGLFLVVVLPLSELTYRWIEQPGRRIPALLRHRATVAMQHEPVATIAEQIAPGDPIATGPIALT
jgi:peptidoglycan/LPS O-acetylase OafA/YrhL